MIIIVLGLLVIAIESYLGVLYSTPCQTSVIQLFTVYIIWVIGSLALLDRSKDRCGSKDESRTLATSRTSFARYARCTANRPTRRFSSFPLRWAC